MALNKGAGALTARRSDAVRFRRKGLSPGNACLLAFALLATACGRKDMTRDEAIAIAESYVRKSYGRDDLYPKNIYPRAAYERRSTWLVHYMSDGGAGGVPTVEIDKKSGKVLMISGGQ